MINDQQESFESSAALFADGLFFLKAGTSIQKLNKLAQNSLNKIEVWCNENGITISHTKSTAILFTKKRKNKEIHFSFSNDNIKTKKEIKYFGVIFPETGLKII